MNFRTRFIASLDFSKPDKVSFLPGGPRESTLKRWHSEGLPEDSDYMEVLCSIIGIPYEKSDYSKYINVLFRMNPMFEEKVLKHEDGHYIVQDWMGAIVEISDTYDLTYLRSAKDFVTRKWHKFPVENKDDWQEMKKRYNVDDPIRLPENFDELAIANKNRTWLQSLSFAGPFWQLREWCGFEGLCMLMVEEPDFVEEMIEFWKDFVSGVMDRFFEKAECDHILISEDMAYKEKSMISPQMAKKFLAPCWSTWSEKVKKHSCKIIEIDSDGYIGELIPIWIESGVNTCSPLEIAAGNNLVEYRKIFGKNMAYRGGVDKRAIAKGGKSLEEAMSFIPFLFEEGGCIPGCDHGVPPDISWNNFIDYGRLLAKMTGWL
ncbi:MAG TPA: uroporphyrinogen decarboxylase family protein [Candidatus Ratteibacteria bacterium]|jgi:uroporphyrinogen decarboxylase|nr:uroporphyrinogen decarboxylase family protein [bacterium]HPC28874.1 uroporphyrinogen decarboxylase family protein [bacterium]HRS06481.1 uroporphyrinogen decarboxylase family protein [Candidatus Ratteibacteria bacterium]HRV03900.1 uroporphyrinogen decarboxylase family protein [Candidatus Ratteibacteria bacterium]